MQELEDVMFDESDGRATPRARIYLLKRDLLALRRAVSPLVDVCNRLMRFDLPHIPDDTRPYFRDVYDHIVRLNETIDAQRELLTTALEAHLSLMSVRAERAHEAHHRVGGDDRRADDVSRLQATGPAAAGRYMFGLPHSSPHSV